MQHSQLTTHNSKRITLWLTLCAALVVCMVLVGGYTRLSGSGLSITEWKPIHGVIPPLNEAEWQEEFAKYRTIPQYAQVNKGMSLDEFKAIFWPEFAHRVLGRIIGIVFFFPLVFFWCTGAISNRFGWRLTVIFSLGGLQGFMGWYMVASGLSENIYVSHFRLAAHLTMALLLLGLIVWNICSVSSFSRRRKSIREWTPAFAGATIWFVLLTLQIIYGALTAGLHAGLLYNTYPTMNGEWLPSDITGAIFTNPASVQFIHRWLAVIVALGFGFWWFFNRTYVRDKKLIKIAYSIAAVIALQFTLGVLTLINAVPLGLGLMHQMTAVLLFVLAVILLHRLGKSD